MASCHYALCRKLTDRTFLSLCTHTPRRYFRAAPRATDIENTVWEEVDPYGKEIKKRELQETPRSSTKVYLFKGRPIQELTFRKIPSGGRNDYGIQTSRTKGRGHAKLIRLVDFKRGREDIWATVLRLEYDPNRTAPIALIRYDDGVLSYIPATANVGPGSRVIKSKNAPIAAGNCTPLRRIPLDCVIHNVEFHPGFGGQAVRSSAVGAQVVDKMDDVVTLKMPSKEIRNFSADCWATIGKVCEGTPRRRPFRKAGENRWKGIHPHVRGCAMQKHLHPHGSEFHGHPFKSKPPKNKWNKPATNYRTRPTKRPVTHIVTPRPRSTPQNRDVGRDKSVRKITKQI